eukprot:COSAG02_NODE_11560_length_1699_cov_5.274194_2_plen_194_part_00
MCCTHCNARTIASHLRLGIGRASPTSSGGAELPACIHPLPGDTRAYSTSATAGTTAAATDHACGRLRHAISAPAVLRGVPLSPKSLLLLLLLLQLLQLLQLLLANRCCPLLLLHVRLLLCVRRPATAAARAAATPSTAAATTTATTTAAATTAARDDLAATTRTATFHTNREVLHALWHLPLGCHQGHVHARA